jgi:hypothetical protein
LPSCPRSSQSFSLSVHFQSHNITQDNAGSSASPSASSGGADRSSGSGSFSGGGASASHSGGGNPTNSGGSSGRVGGSGERSTAGGHARGGASQSNAVQGTNARAIGPQKEVKLPKGGQAHPLIGVEKGKTKFPKGPKHLPPQRHWILWHRHPQRPIPDMNNTCGSDVAALIAHRQIVTNYALAEEQACVGLPSATCGSTRMAYASAMAEESKMLEQVSGCPMPEWIEITTVAPPFTSNFQLRPEPKK